MLLKLFLFLLPIYLFSGEVVWEKSNNKNSSIIMYKIFPEIKKNTLQIRNSLWTNFDKVPHMPWLKAKKYCDNLVIGNINNWMLPSILELKSIGKQTVYDKEFNLKIFSIDSSFKNYKSDFWSKDSVYGNTRQAYGSASSNFTKIKYTIKKWRTYV